MLTMQLTARPSFGGSAAFIMPNSSVQRKPGGDGDRDRRNLKLLKLKKLLDEFRKLDPTMPIAQVQSFLLAAQENNMSVSEMAERTGIKVSTSSRYLIQLGPKRHDEDPAYGLLERGVDPMEPRRARYTLSRRGKGLVARVLSILDDDLCNGDDDEA